MDLLLIFSAFLIGIISSFIGGIAGGGGGLLTIPALTLLGLPPNIAVATNKFGTLGTGASTIYTFTKAKQIVFKHVIPLAVLSAIGSIIGANLLLQIDKAMLSKAIAVFIVLALPLIFLKKDIGLKKKAVSIKYTFIGYLLYFFIGIYDAFFGAGSGLIAVYIFITFLGLTIIEASATDKIPWLINTIIAAGIFAYYGLIDYYFGFALIAGMLIGGYLGASLAIKKGNLFVKICFSIIVLLTVAKMIFF